MIQDIFDLIKKEEERQQNNIELIASENIVSENVLKATGSILTNKYAEGYPEHRYYNGCEFIDKIETIAIEEAKKLFNVEYVNVQPANGSVMNMQVYKALLKNGDIISGQHINMGGHLTHGASVSISGTDYHAIQYGLTSDGYIDYDEIEKIVKENDVKMIVCGASAYSREIDWKKIKQIRDEYRPSAYILADISHYAGLIVAGEYPSPVGIADVITTTTHKTLRGPRGGIIMTNNQEIAKKINFAVFPFSSGGPLEHVIAAKAIAFMEAQTQEFKQYAKQIKKNIQAMISVFKKNGFKIVSNGSDSHMFLLDLTPFKISGKKTADMLDLCGITLNMNLIPNDPLSPKKTSGVRIGTPAITTRGFKEEECFEIANIISDIVNFIKDKKDEELNNNKLWIKQYKERVKKLTEKYPLKK